MTATLNHLIAEASLLAGENLCAVGHAWESIGGRECPRELEVECSQAVYRCGRCGEYDYGQPGGPAHADCQATCKHRHMWKR